MAQLAEFIQIKTSQPHKHVYAHMYILNHMTNVNFGKKIVNARVEILSTAEVEYASIWQIVSTELPTHTCMYVVHVPRLSFTNSCQ